MASTPVPFSRQDIISERFIHRDLMGRAAAIAEETRAAWKKTQAIEPYAITWPSEAVKTDDKGSVIGAVLCRLPPEATSAERLEVLRKMVTRTKAYGLVLVERRGAAIHVLFETHHGARAWLMPLERHGDVTVCGEPEVRENAECVGILWQARRGES